MHRVSFISKLQGRACPIIIRLVVLKSALPIVTVHPGDLNSRQNILTEFLYLVNVKTGDELKENMHTICGCFRLVLTSVAIHSIIFTEVGPAMDKVRPVW
jgi:hypothetical protein